MEQKQQTEIVKKLNSNVLSVLTSKQLVGFEKAYLIANATVELKKSLTLEYMKPIMELQGNRLGFKTDKDATGGYPEGVVKNCLIEAVLTGVQPYGNQFNIIAGNMYITKEGYGELLKKVEGLQYEITFNLPTISSDKTSAAITAKITWTLDGKTNEKEMPIPVKMNQYMGPDAVIGKATRKARAWLYNTITGVETADGDITDIPHTVVSTKETVSKEELEMLLMERKDLLNNADYNVAKRILDNEESASYKKLKDKLLNVKP